MRSTTARGTRSHGRIFAGRRPCASQVAGARRSAAHKAGWAGAYVAQISLRLRTRKTRDKRWPAGPGVRRAACSRDDNSIRPSLAFGSRNRGGVTTSDLALPYRIPARTYTSIHSSSCRQSPLQSVSQSVVPPVQLLPSFVVLLRAQRGTHGDTTPALADHGG